MGERARQQGCCAAPDCPTTFDDRAVLGQRRLILVRRISAVCSVMTCAAALVSLLPSVPVGSETAERLAWAAAVWGLPRFLGAARAALAARKVTPVLLVAVGLVVIAIAGLPLITAVVVAAVLVSDLVRRPVTSPGAPVAVRTSDAQRA